MSIRHNPHGSWRLSGSFLVWEDTGRQLWCRQYAWGTFFVLFSPIGECQSSLLDIGWIDPTSNRLPDIFSSVPQVHLEKTPMPLTHAMPYCTTWEQSKLSISHIPVFRYVSTIVYQFANQKHRHVLESPQRVSGVRWTATWVTSRCTTQLSVSFKIHLTWNGEMDYCTSGTGILFFYGWDMILIFIQGNFLGMRMAAVTQRQRRTPNQIVLARGSVQWTDSRPKCRLASTDPLPWFPLIQLYLCPAQWAPLFQLYLHQWWSMCQVPQGHCVTLIRPLFLIPLSRMVRQRDSIAPSWKRQNQCIIRHVYLESSGKMLSRLHYTSTTDGLCNDISGKPPLNSSMETNLVFLTAGYSVVPLLSLSHQRWDRISYLQKQKRWHSLDMKLIPKDGDSGHNNDTDCLSPLIPPLMRLVFCPVPERM